MEEEITSEQKLAIVGAIEQQFKKGLCSSLVEYSPLVAQDYLIETGELDKYEIDMVKQFKILEDLDSDGCGIEIDIIENYLIPESRTIYDGLHNFLSLSDNPDEREQAIFDARFFRGSVYIRTTIRGIKEAKSYYARRYKACLEFDESYINYRIICSPGGKIYSSYLHDDRPPQRIVKHVITSYGAGKRVTKVQLNKELYKEEYEDGVWVIGKNKSIKHHTFARHKELRHFFKLEKDAITYLGNKAKGLTQTDINNLGQK